MWYFFCCALRCIDSGMGVWDLVSICTEQHHSFAPVSYSSRYQLPCIHCEPFHSASSYWFPMWEASSTSGTRASTCWLYMPETVEGEPVSALCSMCHCRSVWVDVLLMEFTSASGLWTKLPSHYHKPLSFSSNTTSSFLKRLFFLYLLDLAVPLKVYAESQN